MDILYCYLNDAWFFKGGKCGCFVLIKNDLWSIWVPRKNWMIVVRIKIKEEMHRFLHLKYYFLIMEMSIGMWFLLMFGWVCLELVWLSFSTELESERERERERKREKEPSEIKYLLEGCFCLLQVKKKNNKIITFFSFLKLVSFYYYRERESGVIICKFERKQSEGERER